MSPLPDGRLHRRRLLSAVAVAAAAPLTACEDSPLDVSDESASAGLDVDPDEALLDDAVRSESAMLASLQLLLRTAPPPLRATLRRTISVHRDHLGVLRQQRDAPPGSAQLLGVSEVAAREEWLSRRHADAAVRASSGQFARVLAGMAAGAAQQAETWRRGGRS